MSITKKFISMLLLVFSILTNSYANIIFGSDYGTYFSSNNGLNWSKVSIKGQPFLNTNAEVVYTDGKVMLAGVNVVGLVVSFDAGRTWSLSNSIPATLATFYKIQKINGIIYVSMLTGMYRSNNDGKTFNKVLNQGGGITNNGNVLIVASGTNSGTDIYRSIDNGVTWSNVSSLKVSSYSIAESNGVYFLGTGLSGLYRSLDKGETWSKSAELFGLGIKHIGVSNGMIFASANYNGQYLSLDNGLSWKKISDLSNTTDLNYMFSGNNVVAGDSGGGAYISLNNGLSGTWTIIPNIPTSQSIISQASTGKKMALGTNKGFGSSAPPPNIYISDDGGISWSAPSLPVNTPSIHSISIS